MSSPASLLGIFGDVLIVLALAAAVANRRVSRLARPLIATCAFACAWLLTAMLDALRAPGWTIFTGGVEIMVSIVVISLTVHLWTQASEGTERHPGERGDEGGGEPRPDRPNAPDPRGGGNDPSWWPEFERQVALYVAEREREKRQSVVAPVEPGSARRAHHGGRAIRVKAGRSEMG